MSAHTTEIVLAAVAALDLFALILLPFTRRPAQKVPHPAESMEAAGAGAQRTTDITQLAQSDAIESLLNSVELDELTLRRESRAESRLVNDLAGWRNDRAGTVPPVPARVGRSGGATTGAVGRTA